MKKTPEVGDYVLGTKWGDGHQTDPFAVGYVKTVTDYYGEPICEIADENGKTIIRTARRCEVISERVGNTLVEAIKMGILGDMPGLLPHSMWHWRRKIKTLRNVINTRRNSN